jgi:spore coat polysaccharide biosynthesis protein SpsF (cytidylyltransferase family)
MEYLVSLADLVMQVFLCFWDDEEVGMQVFHDEEEVRMECLATVWIEEEEEEEEEEENVGNHVRNEPVSYCVNYKESVP